MRTFRLAKPFTGKKARKGSFEAKIQGIRIHEGILKARLKRSGLWNPDGVKLNSLVVTRITNEP